MTENMLAKVPRPSFTITWVAGLIAVIACILTFSDDQNEALWGNLTIGMTSAMSVGMGALLLSKRASLGPERRAYVALVMALSFWFSAWMLWSYYELAFGAGPYPSPADALWLAGYGLSIYYVVWAYRKASSRLLESRLISLFLTTIIVSVIIAIFLFPLIGFTLGAGGDWPALSISLAYPILDGVLLAMAILTIVSLRPGKNPQFAPSAMIMAAILAAVIADTGYGYGAVTDSQLLEEQDRIWDAFYNAAYLCIAGALYWKYMLYSKSE
ncbi:MAG: hypothetical protein AB1351_07405 [Thermoproteota archaeon]